MKAECLFPYNCGRHGGLVVSVLNCGASAPGSSSGWGHCVVFLGETLKGPLKYLLMPLLGKSQLAITLHMYASIGPHLDNTQRGQM